MTRKAIPFQRTGTIFLFCLSLFTEVRAESIPLAFRQTSSNEVRIATSAQPNGGAVLSPRTGALRGVVILPDGAAASQLLFYLRDRDGHWFQRLLPGLLHPGQNEWSIDISPSLSHLWESHGHHMIFNRRSLLDAQIAGFRVFPSSGEFQSICSLEDTAPHRLPLPENLRPNAEDLPCFSLFELRFALPDKYDNPFDPDEISVDALITRNGVEEWRTPCFYTQDFYVTTNLYADRRTPAGRPEWALRYSPVREGHYECCLIARDADGVATSTPVYFDATPATDPDFVRVSQKDPRKFEVAGHEFTPIGHNLRSPFDTRMDEQFPWRIRHAEGFMSYGRRFSDMSRAGENIAEIWMCQWSLGLEWSNVAPGYHGLGDYNLGNAWELDQVLAMARKNKIRINLILNNHGRAGLGFDAEWQDSPYNIKQGGFLPEDDPMRFFSDAKAMKYHKRLLRYIVARWGWDSTIFAWELWSELDLCGKHGTKPAPQFDPDVIAWHAKIGDYIKSIDINRHLVTTHLSANWRITSPELAALPQLDHCCIDAYHNSKNPLHIAKLVRQTADCYAQFKKPVLITEFGGSSMGAGLSHLKRELHAALWASVCSPLAGTPFFWWWGLIEEQNLYAEYTAIRNFCDATERRDPKLMPTQLLIYSETNTLDHVAIASKTNLFAWIYEKMETPHDGAIANCTVEWSPITPGVYRVAFVDTKTGLPALQKDFRSRGDSLSFELPPFTNDIALRVTKKD